MGLFGGKKANSVPDAMLRRAFRLGESQSREDHRAAEAQYEAITQQYPDCSVAWYNLAVVRMKAGNWQEAFASLSKAQETPEFRAAAAYARLRLWVEHAVPAREEELPEEFRGKNLDALGLQGPCYNGANALRNMGYACTVQAKSEYSCKLTVTAGKIAYEIVLTDFFGTLLKNVYRKTNGKTVDLLEAKNRTKLDDTIMGLNLCDLAIVQAPAAKP